MLTVVSKPLEGGSVTFDPALCANHTYDSGTTVTLTALASKGYQFDNWTGDVGSTAVGSPVITVLMNQNRTIYANFARSVLHCTVTLTVEPSGGGSVDFSDAMPREGYPVNETISMFANANRGYVFSHWTGDLAGADNPRSIRVSDNKSITAVFNPTVSVYCSPFDGGSVTLEPESLSGYAAGTEVTITAKPAKGYAFVAWDGDLSGSASSVTVTMDEPKTITARFEEQSASRWWLWVIAGVGCLFGALVFVRLAYARMSRPALEGPVQYGD